MSMYSININRIEKSSKTKKAFFRFCKSGYLCFSEMPTGHEKKQEFFSNPKKERA